MGFILNKPDHAYSIRSVSADAIVVNERQLTSSFYLSPSELHEDWSARDANAMAPADLAGPLALEPEVILLGTGTQQRFPAPEVMAACLVRGVGVEVMTNSAAARTFSVLASEGRHVVAGFMLDRNLD